MEKQIRWCSLFRKLTSWMSGTESEDKPFTQMRKMSVATNRWESRWRAQRLVRQRSQHKKDKPVLAPWPLTLLTLLLHPGHHPRQKAWEQEHRQTVNQTVKVFVTEQNKRHGDLLISGNDQETKNKNNALVCVHAVFTLLSLQLPDAALWWQITNKYAVVITEILRNNLYGVHVIPLHNK